MHPADIAPALRDSVEPLHSRVIASQQEVASCLAHLQRRAYTNPRAAAIAHQWIYQLQLQLPHAVCSGFETPMVTELETSTTEMTGEFRVERGLLKNPLPRIR